MYEKEADEEFRTRVRMRIDGLCKPPGSLGTIERVAAELCSTQRTLNPQTKPRQATVFAADHGVTAERVSAWPSSVTGAVVEQMQVARTASGVFARSLGCDYEVVDIGLLEPMSVCHRTGLNRARRRGTGNLRIEPALSEDDFQYAWSVGAERAVAAVDAEMRLLIGGEMGIGNTTPATCLIALLCEVENEHDIAGLVGTGAGANDDQLVRKREVVQSAVQRVRSARIEQPEQIGCHVGGLEIAALAGFYASCAEQSRTILVDGLIATAAALLADAIRPGTRRSMLAAHRSTEPAHRVALDRLGLEPIQDLNMCLGEGTGALAALPLVDLAAAMMNEMASLDELEL